MFGDKHLKQKKFPHSHTAVFDYATLKTDLEQNELLFVLAFNHLSFLYS